MDKDAIDILQLTDLHIAPGDDAMWGLDTYALFDRVLSAALETPADLLLLTGDLAQDPVPEAYQRIHARLQDCRQPVYRLPGNHDDPALMAEILRGGAFQEASCMRFQHWQIILLDSSQPESPAGHIAASELERLTSVLDERPELHALVCLHHNPLPVQSRWLDTMTVNNADELFQVLDTRPQVRAVLFGHVHQEFRCQRRGVEYLGSPSTCVQFHQRSTEFTLTDLPPGYRLLRLHADGGLSTQVHFVSASQPEPPPTTEPS